MVYQSEPEAPSGFLHHLRHNGRDEFTEVRLDTLQDLHLPHGRLKLMERGFQLPVLFRQVPVEELYLAECLGGLQCKGTVVGEGTKQLPVLAGIGLLG